MKTQRQRPNSSRVNLGFQIAPMVDVVFVILLFFMVMAGTLRVENAHNIRLPSDSPLPLLDEIAILIESDGQVSLNDDPLDTPASKSLPELTRNLTQLRSNSDASQSDVMITLYADESARYERIVDTLDALARANIRKVTFQAGAPE
jgi:biopolymer transport protein ExbD